MSRTVDLCSCRVEEQIVLKRFLLLEYAMVSCVMFIGSFVGVLLYVRISHVVGEFCSR